MEISAEAMKCIDDRVAWSFDQSRGLWRISLDDTYHATGADKATAVLRLEACLISLRGKGLFGS